MTAIDTTKIPNLDDPEVRRALRQSGVLRGGPDKVKAEAQRKKLDTSKWRIRSPEEVKRAKDAARYYLANVGKSAKAWGFGTRVAEMYGISTKDLHRELQTIRRLKNVFERRASA